MVKNRLISFFLELIGTKPFWLGVGFLVSAFGMKELGALPWEYAAVFGAAITGVVDALHRKRVRRRTKDVPGK